MRHPRPEDYQPAALAPAPSTASSARSGACGSHIISTSTRYPPGQRADYSANLHKRNKRKKSHHYKEGRTHPSTATMPVDSSKVNHQKELSRGTACINTWLGEAKRSIFNLSASLARVLKSSATGSVRFRTLNSVPSPTRGAPRWTVVGCSGAQ